MAVAAKKATATSGKATTPKPKVVKPKRFEVGYTFNVPCRIVSTDEDCSGDVSYNIEVASDTWELYSDTLTKEDFIALEDSFKPNPVRDALKEKIKLAEEQLKALKAELSTTK